MAEPQFARLHYHSCHILFVRIEPLSPAYLLGERMTYGHGFEIPGVILEASYHKYILITLIYLNSYLTYNYYKNINEVFYFLFLYQVFKIRYAFHT